MLSYVIRRAAFGMLLAAVVATGAFLLGHLAQGDFVGQALGIGARADTAARLRLQYGLHESLAARYTAWLSGVTRGDLGTSLLYQRPVVELLVPRTGSTLVLGAVALLIAIGLGLPAGLITASRPRSPAARVIASAGLVLLSVPSLLSALALLWFAAVSGMFPVGGMVGPSAAPGAIGWLRDLAWHLPVPALALGLPLAAVLERVQSQALRQALDHPSMVAAAARGVSPRAIARRHALRLGLAPVLGIGGLVAGAALSGSFAVELVTSWPGLGRLTYDALVARDVVLATACAMTGALLVASTALAADLGLAAVDPRVVHGAPTERAGWP